MSTINLPRGNFYGLGYNNKSRDFLSNQKLLEGIPISQLEKQGVNFAFYTVTQLDIDRPDMIAQRIYRDFRYWWVLLRLNRIIDPINDIYVGQRLKYVDKSYLDKFLADAILSKKNDGEL